MGVMEEEVVDVGGGGEKAEEVERGEEMKGE